MQIKGFGDSITYGYPYTGTPTNMWINQVGSALGASVVNQGVSSAQAGDQSYLDQTVVPADLQTIMLGTNDATIYNTSTLKRSLYIKFMRSLIITMSGGSYQSARAMSKTGTWTNISAGGNTLGMYTDTNGATASCTFYGDAVYIGYIHHTSTDSDSVFTIHVDNVLIDTVTLTGSTDGWTTYLGRTYTDACLYYKGFGTGAHTVKITNVSSTKRLHLEYVYGSERNIFKKPLFVINIPKKVSYTSPDSDANVANYNSDLLSLVNEFKANNYPVRYVDINSILSTSTDYYDSVHPNVSGHTKIANAVLSAITALTLEASTSCPPCPPVLNGTYTKTAQVTYNSGELTKVEVS